MPLDLTRKQLYDPIWTKPRSQIAKELRVSDVRLGKLCREMNVPAPPRGYWANLAGKRRKRKYEKPPLSYNLAERIEEDHAAVWASFPNFDPKDFDQPIPTPPSIPYSLEEALQRYKLLVDKTPVPKATHGLHPITQKLAAEDERLAKLATQYSWEKPKFQSPGGKELLQGLNQLLWMWTDLGFKPRSHGYRNIGLSIGRSGYRRSFEVIRPEEEPTHGRIIRKTRRPGFELWFDTESWERKSKKPAMIFPTFTRAVLRSIALSIVGHWESGFRESVKRHYDWIVADRKAALEQAEQARKRERQRKAAELKALLDARQKPLKDAVGNVDRSNEIRALVHALEERIGPHVEQVPGFDRWRKWALSEAEVIDPRARSLAELNEWFDEFRLEAIG
jgi:hypothetical protein